MPGFASVGEPPTPTGLPGDELLPGAPLSWDRGAALSRPPADVWPWLLQLGKGRAGWYVPRALERWQPARFRALRRIDPAYQTVRVGDRVPDYGPDGWFEARVVEPPRALVWWSERGRGLRLSWALVLTATPSGSELWIRLRMNRRLGNRFRPLVEGGGEFMDRVTISLMLAGLRERVHAR